LRHKPWLLTELAAEPGIAIEDAAEFRARAENALNRGRLVRESLAEGDEGGE
jgi:hypothetical protein